MKFEDKRETYANIATLYYMGEMSQDDIAQLYNISRFKVSRVLKKCRSMKIVEFRINNQPSYYKNLEVKLEELFGLKQVMIAVPGSTLEESKENVGKVAASYLESNLEDGMNIGISWGTTMQEIARKFKCDKTYPNAVFVQLSGNICSQPIFEKGYMDGRDIVQSLANNAGSGWSFFQVPYIVQSKILRTLLINEQSIRKHMNYLENLDMAFIGVGSSIPDKSVSYTSGYITLDDSKKLVDDGAGADISGIRLTINGEVPETMLSGRVLTIEPDTLKKVSNVIAVAAGADKVLSLVAGVRGGYINRLIIDEVAALSMLDFMKND